MFELITVIVFLYITVCFKVFLFVFSLCDAIMILAGLTWSETFQAGFPQTAYFHVMTPFCFSFLLFWVPYFQFPFVVILSDGRSFAVNPDKRDHWKSDPTLKNTTSSLYKLNIPDDRS